jgi:hypothetical protein
MVDHELVQRTKGEGVMGQKPLIAHHTIGMTSYAC